MKGRGKEDIHLKKAPYFEAKISKALSTLLALFPQRWDSIPESTGTQNRLGKHWSTLLEAHSTLEKAVFLDSLLPSEPDGFPAAWRRFIRVGSSLSEQTANVFELCFEKGYERVVFAETICAALPEENLNSFLTAMEEYEMVLLPAGDGSVLMAAMQLQRYSDWDFYRFHEAGSIVEMLSDCHDKGIKYKVMEPLDLSVAAPALLQMLREGISPKPI